MGVRVILLETLKGIIMIIINKTSQSGQRYPGDRKWKNEDVPETDDKKPKEQ